MFKTSLLKHSLVALSVMGLVACANQPQQASQSLTSSPASGATYLKVKHAPVSMAQLRRLAQHGDADAQYALGYRLYYGIGVRQNLNESNLWLQRSASHGQPQARQALLLIKQAGNVDNHQQNLANSPVASQESTVQTTQGTAQQQVSQQNSQQTSPSSQAAANSSGFTLQLMGTHDKQSLVDFIIKNNLQDKATYYRRSFDGEDWYVLVSGRFTSQEDAVNAIEQLPEAVQRMNPWVKPLGLVRQEMQS